MSVVVKVAVTLLVFALIVIGALAAVMILSPGTAVPTNYGKTTQSGPTVSPPIDETTYSNPFIEPSASPTYSNPFVENQSDYTNPFSPE